MSSLAPQPDPQAADEIVAYLDGELPPQDCRRVESRLASDENYRQELHQLDRAWEALDVLPTTTVGDDFARTTIELACIAAKEDVTDHAAVRRAANRNRALRWITAAAAAIIIGLLLGMALLPNPNKRLLADLPAIQQVDVLPYVKNIEVLRELSKTVSVDQMVKDDAALDREVKALASANDMSPTVRRDWLRSLSPEQKAVLADSVRQFRDWDSSPEKQQHMRQIMDEIRDSPDAAKLQQTLAAYGQWLGPHSAGQKRQFEEELDHTPPGQEAEFIRKRIERESELAIRHLSPDDADKFRQEIFQIVRDKRPEIMDRLTKNRKMGGPQNVEEQVARQAAAVLGKELMTASPAIRQEIEDRLIAKLSPTAKAQWEKLARRQRDFGRPRQMAIWFRDAMNLKVDPEALERFFAEDEKLTDDQRERLLNLSRARFDNQLEQLYFTSELGVDVSQIGDSPLPPRNAPAPDRPMRRPAGPGIDGPMRPREPGSRLFQRGKDERLDRAPDERPPHNPPQRPPSPPPKNDKQEPI